MAEKTPLSLRNSVIYEVFVRSHGNSGTFKDVKDDLDRIKKLGVDIIWFMPIHTIGRKNKKGSIGSPYSVKNYNRVNPDFGTLDEFKDLISEIHKRDMKVMMDVVFHHTSCDSFLSDNYGDLFIKNENGNFSRKIKEWNDIIDFDFSRPELYSLLLDVLKLWVDSGIDGFRCDFACFVPLNFWKFARKELDMIKPDLVWLAETSSPSFLDNLEKEGHKGLSDKELFEVFDMVYDEDGYPYFLGYLQGDVSLEEYIDILKKQDEVLPENHIKLRFLENHDKSRAKKIIPNNGRLLNWTTFLYMVKGATLLYAGQEAQEEYTQSLFDIDMIDWDGLDDEFTSFLVKLSNIKKKNLLTEGEYSISVVDNQHMVIISYKKEDSGLVVIMNMNGSQGICKVDLPDGDYENLLYGRQVIVENSEIRGADKPIILEY